MGQVTLKSIRNSVWIVASIVLAAGLAVVGGYFVREDNAEQDRLERRLNTCASIRAVADANKAFLEEILVGEDLTPDEQAEVEEARRRYDEIMDPAVEKCGKTGE